MTTANRSRILIVDDDLDQLTVRELLLQARGFQTLAAGDAQSAFALAEAERPDCALLDLNLPTEAAGLALLRSLRGLPFPPRVVVLTGTNIKRLRCARELQEADAVLEKGSPSNTLVELLRTVCSKPA